MQLYALDSLHQLISAPHAFKQSNYRCCECGGIVRVRCGLHRQPHFFHLKRSSSCRLSGKGMAHLQVQNRLFDLLPTGDCLLEKRFPQINRIADAVWESKKIIFEVQCSPITSEEVSQRIQDYQSIGYQVVWILHDREFNQHRLRSAELYLRSSPYFFTDIDSAGQGKIYDQFDLFAKGLRLKKMAPLPIDLTQPLPVPTSINTTIPSMLQERLTTWPIHFQGDLIDLCHFPSKYLEDACQAEKKSLPSSLKFTDWLIKLLFRPYKLLFQLLPNL